MSNIKIMSRIDKSEITEEDAVSKAIDIVNTLTTASQLSGSNTNIIKLYYIVPSLGRLLVVISDRDRDALGVPDNVLSNVLISQYPLVKLPSSLIEYKELLVKADSDLTDTEILNVAQSIADSVNLEDNNIPIVKIINYSNRSEHIIDDRGNILETPAEPLEDMGNILDTDKTTISLGKITDKLELYTLEGKLVTHSIFGTSLPSIGVGEEIVLSNNGNSNNGKLIIKNNKD